MNLDSLDGVAESRKSSISVPHSLDGIEIHLLNAEALAHVDRLPVGSDGRVVGIVLV